MITEIHMDAVASFKQASSLKTDKKINLIYGLNGTGKSTISDFLYKPDDSRFAHCRKVPHPTSPILVYNQKFIQDNFFVSDNLKGIFSLSKENKEAEEKIAKATKILSELDQSKQGMQTEKEKTSQEFAKQRQRAIDNIWEIKTNYCGGDRVLEYCLEGFMGKKEKLFEHLLEIEKPCNEPKKNIQTIRDEVDALKGDAAQEYPILQLLTFAASDVESETVFGSAIIGNADSEVAALIDKLGNSDWVRQGLYYLPEEADESGKTCPFCQENTITSKFVASIREYFDDTYQQQIDNLESLRRKYVSALEQLGSINAFINHPFELVNKASQSISKKYQILVDTLRSNVAKIEQKIKKPKIPQTLADSTTALAEFNQEIASINEVIVTHNEKLKKRDAELSLLKSEFWSLMRWQYDQTLARFKIDQLSADQKLKKLDDEISKINLKISDAKEQIALTQKRTVNVDEAVNAINDGLLDLGIDDFRVLKYSERLYRVVRPGDSTHAFHTLSEGEKMMISFLYFCELCKGKSSPDDTHAQRIVVIDDPISSLSHIFVFNVGQLIKSVFFKGERFSQVFVLTHSLYFFYELTDTNHDRRKQDQKLFRIIKSASGSSIYEMKYEEVQNDYQAYWIVINDPNEKPALIANCMRNIVEYFFNFVRKRDLNNVFQMKEFQSVKFQAFCRYINRESHSLGQNIIDMKEFDYQAFREGLRLVFEQTGYSDHFKEMSKL